MLFYSETVLLFFNMSVSKVEQRVYRFLKKSGFLFSTYQVDFYYKLTVLL